MRSLLHRALTPSIASAGQRAQLVTFLTHGGMKAKIMGHIPHLGSWNFRTHPSSRHFEILGKQFWVREILTDPEFIYLPI